MLTYAAPLCSALVRPSRRVVTIALSHSKRVDCVQQSVMESSKTLRASDMQGEAERAGSAQLGEGKLKEILPMCVKARWGGE